DATPETPPVDPSLTPVAFGADTVYRLRDLDALMMVTTRHLQRQPDEQEEQALRDLLADILVAREGVVALLNKLPPGLDESAREALILDLLAYRPATLPAVTRLPENHNQAAPSSQAAPQAGAATPVIPAGAEALLKPVEQAEPTTPTAPDAQADAPKPEPAAPATHADAAPEADAASPTGPAHSTVIPSIRLSRRDADGGTLSAQVQIVLHDTTREAGAWSDQLPLFQDALINHLHAIPAATLRRGDLPTLRTGFAAVIRKAVPAFTGDILITEFVLY
ncbi:MAG: hypothetical protein PF961_00860, partial [Planctomycetota bacterium]|nr:hypothetical protein [Planctomycetota bacterium]